MTRNYPALLLVAAAVAAGCQKESAPTAPAAPPRAAATPPGRSQPTPTSPAATTPAAKGPTLYLTPEAFAAAARIPPDVVAAWKKANAFPTWYGFHPKHQDYRTSMDRAELTDPVPCFSLDSDFRAGSLEQLPTPPVPFAIYATYRRHTDPTLRGIGKHQTLAGLGLDGSGVTEKGLEEVGTLPNLKVLTLSVTNVGDAGLKHVGRLTTLTALAANTVKATDAGLAHLKGLTNLTWLNLWGNGLQRPGPVLAGFPRLRVLRVGATAAPGETVRALGNLKDLRELHLFLDREDPRDDSLAGVKDLKSVERLTLDVPVSPGDVEHFKGLTGLKYLKLGHSSTAVGLKDAFQAALPNCEVVVK